MKQHACEFANWLWHNISEDQMSLYSWEQLYEMWLDTTQTRI